MKYFVKKNGRAQKTVAASAAKALRNRLFEMETDVLIAKLCQLERRMKSGQHPDAALIHEAWGRLFELDNQSDDQSDDQ